MIVDERSWHYRLYSYWLEHWAVVKPMGTLNLCHYMRAIIIFLPCSFVLYVLVNGTYYLTWPLWRPLLLLWRTSRRFRGWMQRLDAFLNAHKRVAPGLVAGTFMVGMTVVFAVSGGIWSALIFLGGLIAALFAYGLLLGLMSTVGGMAKRSAKGERVLPIGIQWIKARKARICPIIEVRREQ